MRGWSQDPRVQRITNNALNRMARITTPVGRYAPVVIRVAPPAASAALFDLRGCLVTGAAGQRRAGAPGAWVRRADGSTVLTVLPLVQ